MKFYSETLKKIFNSEDECLKAEAEHAAKVSEEEKAKKELAEQRKARAKEVEDAYKAVVEAQKTYTKLKDAFIKDYKTFHISFSTTDDWNIFDEFFKIF